MATLVAWRTGQLRPSPSALVHRVPETTLSPSQLELTMTSMTKMFVFALPLLALGCANQASAPTATMPIHAASCDGMSEMAADLATLFEGDAVSSVRPIYRTEFRARAYQPRYLTGARFDVPAPRGMTPAYAERVLSCHARAGTPSHDLDPIGLAGVRDVDVRAAGANFRIEVTSFEREVARAVLTRARALEESAGRVSVREM